jgi:hypothetical protein
MKLLRFSLVIATFFIASANCKAIAGNLPADLLNALNDLNNGYTTALNLVDALNTDVSKNSIPNGTNSTVVSVLTKAATDMQSVSLQTPITAASPPPVSSINSCVAQGNSIYNISSWINQWQAMAANDDAEIISINAALAQTSDVTMELNKLLALAPKLQAIPLGGSVIAAEMFTTYTDGGKQNGIIIAALQAQLKRITSNEAAVKTDIGAWTTFLGQVERV